MAISSLTCLPPIRRAEQAPKPDYEMLEAAVQRFDAGEFRESVQLVFRHLFADRAAEAADAFTFPQGSSRVSVRFADDGMTISVPMVRLPEGGKSTAALRFLLSRVSATGQLYQPRLRGDDVYLEFRDKLSRLHPLKVVEVLRQMPMEADARDDWMVDQFGASPLEREPIEALSPDELAQAETIWRAHWGELEELLKESQRKRSLFFLNEVTAFAFYHLRYSLPLGGSLLARLSESAGVFNDTDEDPLKRESSAAKCAKELKGVSTEELGKSLGHAHYSISPLVDGTPALLSSYLGAGDYVETVESARKSGKSMEAAVALFSTYSFLLGRYAWPEEIEAQLLQGLGEASGKPWREAANILWNHGKALAAAVGDDDDDDDDDDDEDDGEESDDEDEAAEQKDAEVEA
jgi:hypothetical protein